MPAFPQHDCAAWVSHHLTCPLFSQKLVSCHLKGAPPKIPKDVTINRAIEGRTKDITSYDPTTQVRNSIQVDAFSRTETPPADVKRLSNLHDLGFRVLILRSVFFYIPQTLHVYAYIDPPNHPNVGIYMAVAWSIWALLRPNPRESSRITTNGEDLSARGPDRAQHLPAGCPSKYII